MSEKKPKPKVVNVSVDRNKGKVTVTTEGGKTSSRRFGDGWLDDSEATATRKAAEAAQNR